MLDFFGNGRVPNPPPGQGGFNPYAAGNKTYGGGRNMPNIGPTSDPLGYSSRDLKAKARQAAIQARLKGQQTGNPMSTGVMNYLAGVMNG